MAFNTFKGLNRSLQGYTNTQEHLWPSKLLIWLFFSLSNSPHITYPPCASRPKCHRRKKKKHFSINSCLISLLVLDSYSQYTVGKISGFFFFFLRVCQTLVGTHCVYSHKSALRMHFHWPRAWIIHNDLIEVLGSKQTVLLWETGYRREGCSLRRSSLTPSSMRTQITPLKCAKEMNVFSLHPYKTPSCIEAKKREQQKQYKSHRSQENRGLLVLVYGFLI